MKIDYQRNNARFGIGAENLFSIILLIFTLTVASTACKNTRSKFESGSANAKKDTILDQILIQDCLEIDLIKALSCENQVLLSELVNDIKYVKLKTSLHNYLRTILEVKMYSNEIFVADNSQLLVFDMEGNFVRKIGRQGKGPGEYISIRGFCINEMKQSIYIYGGNTGKILKYSLDGKFETESFTYPYADYIDFINDDFVFSGFASFNTRNIPPDIAQYAIVDDYGRPLEKKLLPLYAIKNFRNKQLSFPGTYRNTRYENSLLLYSYGEDTIFQVNEKKAISPRYFLNFDKHSLKLDSRYVSLKENDRSRHIIVLSPPFETKNYLWFKFAFQGLPYIVTYNKQGNNISTQKYKGKERINFLRGKGDVSGFGFKNNYDGGVDFFPKWSIMHGSKQKLISVLDPIQLKSELTSEYFSLSECKDKDKKDELINFVNNLRDDDNSVLMIVTVN